MNRAYNYLIAAAVGLFILIAAILVIQRNNRLVEEKELLILKNDSLHSLQLQTRLELVFTRAKLDSIIQKDKKH